jgi:glycosyltransferase involved in cell wall biosynthesis
VKRRCTRRHPVWSLRSEIHGYDSAVTCERTISVVVAVYNGERFIADALESILRQTRAPFEVCVVDDGSQDKTIDIVRWFPSVTCIECKVNAGQAAALNVGVASTQGDHLAFLDADDVWLPDKLAWQCELLDTRPELDVVYGLMRERTTGVGEALAKRDGRVLPAHLPSAMLIKRAAFERVGDFDERWTLGSVVDWYARACEVGLSQSVLQRVVYERRIHGANLGIATTTFTF